MTCLDGDTFQTLRSPDCPLPRAPRYVAVRLLPELTPEQRRQARAFRYAPYLVANVFVSRTPGPPTWAGETYGDFFCAFRGGRLGRSGRSRPRSRDAAQRAHRVLSPGPAGTAAGVAAPPGGRLRAVDSRRPQRLLPGVRSTVTDLDLYRWGHAILIADKGFVFSAARRADRPAVRTDLLCPPRRRGPADVRKCGRGGVPRPTRRSTLANS